MERIIGILWLVLGFLYLYQGFGYLYKYSTPGILWIVMIPITIAYIKIVCGILSSLIGIKFFNGKSRNSFLLLSLLLLFLIYIVIDIIQYGISTIYYSGENLLSLILTIIYFYKLKSKIGITDLTKKLKENKVSVMGILVFGFTPYLLAKLTTYDYFKFLH